MKTLHSLLPGLRLTNSILAPFLKPLAVAQAKARRNYVTKTYSGRITLIQSDVGVQSRTDSKWPAWQQEDWNATESPAGIAAFLKILGSKKRRRSCNNVCKNFQMEPIASGSYS